jgi:glyoxylate carboligase
MNEPKFKKLGKVDVDQETCAISKREPFPVNSNYLFDVEIAKLENKLDKFRETPAYDSGCRLAQTEERLATFKKAKRMLVKWNKSNDIVSRHGK